MEMHQVRYFLAVAKHLNFTKASTELHVAQPSLTRAIQKLEAELEGELFRRERANTHLTELGRMILPHLRAAASAAEAAKDQARNLKRRDRASLSVGFCDGLAPSRSVDLLLDTAHHFAGLDLSIEVAAIDQVETGLLEGRFDAAILTQVGIGNDRFVLQTIDEDELVVAFAPQHPFASADGIPLEALEAEPLAARCGCRIEDALTTAMKARGITRTVRHRSNDPRWIARFVRSGLACAVMPKAMAVAHGLDHRRIDGLQLEHRTMLATVAGRKHPAALASFIQRVKARRAGYPRSPP